VAPGDLELGRRAVGAHTHQRLAKLVEQANLAPRLRNRPQSQGFRQRCRPIARLDASPIIRHLIGNVAITPAKEKLPPVATEPDLVFVACKRDTAAEPAKELATGHHQLHR
jgi:hypothetical protein